MKRKPMYVTCPSCQRTYYAVAEDYIGMPDAYFRCPFCKKEFRLPEANATIEGRPVDVQTPEEA